MPCDVVVGGFFGDKGKGKIVGYLVSNDYISVAAGVGVGLVLMQDIRST